MMDMATGMSASSAISAGRGFPMVSLTMMAVLMAASATLVGSFSTVQEAAKADIGLSDFQLSLVQGLATSIPIALFQIPLGRMADRHNRVRLMTAMAASWTAGAFMTAIAGDFLTLFVARMLIGLGAMCSIPIGISLVADMCRPEARGRALLLPVTGRWLGAAGAFVVTGWLFGLLGKSDLGWLTDSFVPWRGAHLILAVGSLVLMLPLLLMREPARQEQAVSDVTLRQVWVELNKRRAFLMPLFIGYTAAIMADIGASIWAAPILVRQFGLSPEQFGGWMGLIVFGSGMLGTVFGGFFADLGQRSARRGGVLLAALIAVAVSVPASLFSIAPSVTLFAILLAILLLCGAVIALVTTAALSILIPNELRGISISVTLTVAGLIGYGVAPTLVTWISTLMGGEQNLGRALAITTTVVSFISLLAFVKAMANAPVLDADSATASKN